MEKYGATWEKGDWPVPFGDSILLEDFKSMKMVLTEDVGQSEKVAVKLNSYLGTQTYLNFI